MTRISAVILACLGVCITPLGPAAEEGQQPERPPNAIARISAVRSDKNPLITANSSRTLGNNINGPSVIRVPSWIASPLGRYYMYFASHHGRYIRLAFADSVEGPWRIHEPGTLSLKDAPLFWGHVASPDVHIDDERREIRLYFHGPVRGREKQWTGVAVSKDGLTFDASDQILGSFYFRVFEWMGSHYAIAKDWNSGWGELLRSRSPMAPFERRSRFIHRMRHGAVLLRDDHLLVFYSRVGDAPERILVSTVRLTPDWNDWVESEPMDVLRPERPYEGSRYPVEPSQYGAAINVRQLRDPCVFADDGDSLYLFYSAAGETGIALAKLDIELKEAP